MAFAFYPRNKLEVALNMKIIILNMSRYFQPNRFENTKIYKSFLKIYYACMYIFLYFTEILDRSKIFQIMQ